MRRFVPVFSVAFALLTSACASIIDGQTQAVTIVTPGASESRCYADNGLKYTFENGDTIDVQRSRKPLVIECHAAGNRTITKTVDSTLNKTTAYNVSNAVVPGVSYDSLAGGLWTYPDVITVDFTGTPTRGYELPSYHNRDMPNPYEQAIENYGPTVPKTESDRGYVPPKVEKRAAPESSNPFAVAPAPQPTTQPAAPVTQSVTPGQKPALRGQTAEELTRSMNPSVFNQ